MSRLQFNPSIPLVFVDKQNNRMLQHSSLKSVGVNLCLRSVILVCVLPTCCRAINDKGMVFKEHVDTWVYSKDDTMAHTRRLVVIS